MTRRPAEMPSDDLCEKVARAMMDDEFGIHVPVSKRMRRRAEHAIATMEKIRRPSVEKED